MYCPKCHSGTEVKDSRRKTFLVWRRRSCNHCGHAFTTTEREPISADKHIAIERHLKNIEREVLNLRELMKLEFKTKPEQKEEITNV